MLVRVKICGVRTVRDAEAAVAAGAQALGLNFVPTSPRKVSLETARQILAQLPAHSAAGVALFVNPTLDEVLAAVAALGTQVIQLHGDEPAELGEQLRRRAPVAVWKAYGVRSAADLERITRAAWPCEAILLDAQPSGGISGGTGRCFDWGLLEGWPRPRPLVLAGGLTPENVGEAVRRVRPDWVDTASGVESAPGVKDAVKMRAFVDAVRSAAQAAGT